MNMNFSLKDKNKCIIEVKSDYLEDEIYIMPESEKDLRLIGIIIRIYKFYNIEIINESKFLVERKSIFNSFITFRVHSSGSILKWSEVKYIINE